MPTETIHTEPLLRIGEFSRRVGVDADLLRSWERRYALTSPARTAGGLRLYGRQDEARVRRMLEHLEAGLSAAEAARLARRELDPTPDPAPSRPAGEGGAAAAPAATAVGIVPQELWDALDRLDETAAHDVFDRVLATYSLPVVIRDVLLPYLYELGERWRRLGDPVIAQEHFATAVLRGRLLGLARGWGGGHGPLALLACFPGDHHDLGLICFGLALREHGWRITFLGTNTPFAVIQATAEQLRPALTVLTRMAAGPDDEGVPAGLREIAAHTDLALAGAVSAEVADAVGARRLAGDPFAAAREVADELALRPSGPRPARGRAAATDPGAGA